MKKAFTLVEILIVVIILGILAAIVIPQFTEASSQARDNSLASDLQTVRSQLELYKVQHLERYPSKDDTGADDASTDNFVLRLTSKTLQTGKIDAAGTLGPYLQKFPTNPYADPAVANKVVFAATNPKDGSAGWWFNPATGEFAPCDADHAGL